MDTFSLLASDLSLAHVAMLVAILAASAVMSGLSGFGFSAIGALSLFVLPPLLAVPLLMTLSAANQMLSLNQLKADFTPLRQWWPDGPAPYLLGGAFGVPLGLLILHSVPTALLMAIVGAFLTVYATYSMLKPESLRIPLKGGWRSSALVGMSGGIIGGFTAFPGAAVVTWSGLRHLPKRESRSVVQPYILALQVLSLVLLALQRPATFDRRYWTLLEITLPVVLPCTLLGVNLYKNLSDINFRRITFVLLAVSGVALVVKAANAEPADWVESVRPYGDMRARIEATAFADDNSPGVYRDFNVVNDRGGIGRAGDVALLNTSEDRFRLAGRLRLGLLAQLGNSFKLDARLASGNLRSPVSTNQTLGNYGARWTVNIDKAAVLWNPLNAAADRELDVRFGRFSNPFVTHTELVWDNDVTFEGLSATYALDLFGADLTRMERGLFLTLGAFPLQEVELSGDDKWLYGAQLGGELPIGTQSRLRMTASYFDYQSITGIRNAPDSQEFDFTAPRFVQKGNTLFDIRNDADPGTNLFALAGEYKLLSANVALDLAFDATHVVLGGEYVSNIGWDGMQVRARTGLALDARTSGYEAIVTVGRPVLAAMGQWRAFLSYRYLERDATLDGFTDSELHLGGTDLQGYLAGIDVGLSRGTWLRLRYQSATEIDGPPLGIDVWQLDLNGQF